MKRAGCLALTLALESCDDGMLLRMSKKIRTSSNRVAVLLAKRAGLKVVSYNLVGYPGETIESFMRTLTFNIETRPDAILFQPLTLALDGAPLRGRRECNLVSCTSLPHGECTPGGDSGPPEIQNGRFCMRNRGIEEFHSLIERAKPVFHRKGLAPQMGSRAYLLSSLFPPGARPQVLEGLEAGPEPYEIRLVGRLERLLAGDRGGLGALLEHARRQGGELMNVS